MKQQRVQRHKPAKWVECVVYYSVPQVSREEYVIDLRKRYRARLRSRGARAAKALARREGLACSEKTGLGRLGWRRVLSLAYFT